MSIYETTGTIHHLGQLLSVGAKGAQKRELVLSIGDKWPQTVAFEAFGDKTTELDGARVGDTVKVSFELRGREWTKTPGDAPKFFTSLGLRGLTTLTKAPGPSTSDEMPF
jgi:single-strand DNA-binding protein